MITPPAMVKGDSIAILSTARKITKKELQPLLSLIESWGLKWVLGDTIGASKHQYAGDDALRIRDFQQMLDHPEIKAIWCARGGYGTVRLIDFLDFENFRNNPKWIIGYSDVTVLHNHIFNFGVETLHANMAIDIDTKTLETRSTIYSALFDKKYSIYHNCKNYQNRPGESKGLLVGGNLSLLYSLIGSASKVNTTGKILFIEDLDEMLYHLDRMMQNLKRNGLLSGLAGLIVGGMNDMRDNTIPFGKSAEEIISETVAEYDYPVCYGFPAGHIEDNRALIMGREVELLVTTYESTLNFS